VTDEERGGNVSCEDGRGESRSEKQTDMLGEGLMDQRVERSKDVIVSDDDVGLGSETEVGR
jgi:hypothetical protein